MPVSIVPARESGEQAKTHGVSNPTIDSDKDETQDPFEKEEKE